MSLIQEALKRQQMEQEGRLPEPPPAEPPPPAPPPMQTPPPPTTTPPPRKENVPSGSSAPKPAVLSREPVHSPVQEPENSRRITPAAKPGADEERKHRVLPALAAVLIVLALLAGAVVWALMAGLELAGIRMPWGRHATAVSTVADPTPPDVAAPEAPGLPPSAPSAPSVQASPPKKTIGSVVKTVVKNTGAVANDTDAAMAELSPATAAPQPASSDTKAAEPDAPRPVRADVIAPASPVTAAPPAEIEQQTWPNLTVSGVVGNDRKGAVFINGKVVGVNEAMQGVRVVAIRTQGALLEYNGETRLVKVGQSVNRANF